MNKKERGEIKFAIWFVTIVIIAIAVYALVNQTILKENFSQEVENYGAPALVIVSFILDFIPQTLSPIMILGAGMIAGINVYSAIIAVIIGSTLGSILGFVLGKQYMYAAVDVLVSKKNNKRLTELTNKYGKIIIPLAAVSPLPYIPVIIGAMNFSKRNFILYGLIPRAIGIVGYGILFAFF